MNNLICRLPVKVRSKRNLKHYSIMRRLPGNLFFSSEIRSPLFLTSLKTPCVLLGPDKASMAAPHRSDVSTVNNNFCTILIKSLDRGVLAICVLVVRYGS